MSSFKADWSQYTPIKKSSSGDQTQQMPSSSYVESKVDWTKYEPAEVKADWSQYQPLSGTQEEHPYFGPYAHLTPSQYKALSPEEKKELQNYVPLTGVAKGALKGATLGLTEHVEPLKIKPHETGAGFGEFVGAALPYGGAYSLISKPFQALDKAVKFGKATRAGTNIVAGALTGAAGSLTRQGLKFEGLKGIEPREVALETLIGAGIPAIVESIRGLKYGYDWLKSLKPSQQAQALVEGVIPENMTPDQYKFYEEEVFPKRLDQAKINYQEAYQEAIQKQAYEYEQELANIQAKHEQELYTNEREYKNDLRNAQARHENEMSEIQQQNQIAMQDYEQAVQDFETLQLREQAVNAAIQPHEPTGLEPSLAGRAELLGKEFLPERIKPSSLKPEAHLEDNVGNVINPNPTKEIQTLNNRTRQGKALTDSIRANDRVDYDNVNKMYEKSRELNKQIVIEQPNLVTELRQKLKELNRIPKLSPPEEQMKGIIQQILNDVQILDEAGQFFGYQPISNEILAKQAQAVRYFMDFNFEHGNTRGIFKPLVNMLEDAIEQGAIFSQNKAALTAHREAKEAYRQWAETYDNPYIRPFRDTNNFDYIKNFDSTLHPDNFNQVDKVLNRSNSGQQMSNKVREELVKEKLKTFIDDPRVKTREFNKALKELEGIISPEEEQAIRQQFIMARKKPVVVAKGISLKEAPEKPTLKEITETKIPYAKSVKSVRIPNKPELKPTKEMKAASKIMNSTVEDTMRLADSPTGLRQLKQELSGTEGGRKTFDRIAKHKIKDILYKGKVEHEFTGAELYKIINDGENFSMLSEILGEDAATELLVQSRQIAEKRVTVDKLKKLGTKAGTLKALYLFGVL